jgi:ABC-type antimicrobial peptide transport system permease subunit
VLGFLIVAIGMAGLANALTMSVLERTREIGILRSIGARARHIRCIFAAETIVIAVIGWLIAIPVGLLLKLFLAWMTKTVSASRCRSPSPPGTSHSRSSGRSCSPS